ncbi:MAG TPA: PLP-dependent aminotransferase family protein, partial [Gemmatimonadales bacterium]|nr:PLP-dependent aminotransferase family protein [Gemmatimonadales bacterium]
MRRTSLSSALALPERAHRGSATLWLVDALRQEILSGRLRAGTRLPASRTLAREHGVARGTVQAAFEQLRVEGYVRARTGSGTYVAEELPDSLLRVERPAVASRDARGRRTPLRRLSQSSARIEPPRSYRLPKLRAFRANQPALSLFPTTLWAQVTGRCVRRATMDHLTEGASAGWMPLRQAVANYLTESRGVVCEPEQVLIVSGTQEAVGLVSRALLDPGDTVCIEDPGYV